MSAEIAGRTSSVSAVEVIRPPITTVASGRCTSAPVPVASAIGMKPRLATRAVIKTGRTRSIAPPMMAPSMSSPSSSCLRIALIITSPLRTATPESAMNPTDAVMEKGIPRIAKANTPPARAIGTAVNTTNAGQAPPSAM